MLYHKKIIVTICLSATVVLAAAASMRQQTTEPEKTDWKNLKVLPKNISKKDLDKVMDDWRDALGVRCGFCHARDKATGKTNFASDSLPEKNAAREMMKMTEAINKKYFKADKDSKDMTAAITCYVCHHGNAHPENTAPPRGQRGPGGFGPNAPGGQGGVKLPPPPPAPPAGTVPTSPVTTTPPSK